MSEPPSGAVTFMFTDIEGSTELVRALRTRYAAALAEHGRLIREVVARHDGFEIDTQGDAFFVAFPSAREAVLAAVECQRAMAAHPWPDGSRFLVRMGLHTAHATPVDGRYTGLAVHRAARICAAGHGGQVLVSQTTQSLLEDEDEELASRLQNLGELPLKDFDRPVRLYQVVADGLPAAFPPLRGAPTDARRRPFTAWLIAGSVLAALAVAAAIAVIATRDGGGLDSVPANNVGVIDPEASEIVSAVPVGVRPGPIAAGADAIWVGNLDDRTLTRIDPSTRTAAATVTLEQSTPTGLAAATEAVWIAHGRTGAVSRVDPQFNRLSDTIDVTTGGSTKGAVALGGGAVWAVFSDSTLARIDRTGTRVAASSFAGAEPSGVAYGAGSVWVANEADASVDRYSPTTFDSGPIRTISVGRRPVAIAVGEGAVWVANAGDARVSRIDPGSNALTATIPVAATPVALAVGGGAVWVASSDGTVSRIDPATDAVEATIDVGNSPAGVAVSGGLVWVTVQAP